VYRTGTGSVSEFRMRSRIGYRCEKWTLIRKKRKTLSNNFVFILFEKITNRSSVVDPDPNFLLDPTPDRKRSELNFYAVKVELSSYKKYISLDYTHIMALKLVETRT